MQQNGMIENTLLLEKISKFLSWAWLVWVLSYMFLLKIPSFAIAILISAATAPWIFFTSSLLTNVRWTLHFLGFNPNTLQYTRHFYWSNRETYADFGEEAGVLFIVPFLMLSDSIFVDSTIFELLCLQMMAWSIYFTNDTLIRKLSLYIYISYHVKNNDIICKREEGAAICKSLQLDHSLNKPYITRILTSITMITLFVALCIWSNISHSFVVFFSTFIAWIIMVFSLRALANQFIAKKMLYYILLAKDNDISLSENMYRNLLLTVVGIISFLPIYITISILVMYRIVH